MTDATPEELRKLGRRAFYEARRAEAAALNLRQQERREVMRMVLGLAVADHRHHQEIASRPTPPSFSDDEWIRMMQGDALGGHYAFMEVYCRLHPDGEGEGELEFNRLYEEAIGSR